MGNTSLLRPRYTAGCRGDLVDFRKRLIWWEMFFAESGYWLFAPAIGAREFALCDLLANCHLAMGVAAERSLVHRRRATCFHLVVWLTQAGFPNGSFGGEQSARDSGADLTS